ncbi:Fc receptor-like protein 5 [Paroedura picta]|uniref:Fc receptor-like protein 5 n=1 Tax=Paroedura picta TaxID=143630 RepID=UPI004057B42D
MTGQEVTLTCSQYGLQKTRKFIFLKDKAELSSSEWSMEPTESYLLARLNVSSSGEYSCRYCLIFKARQPIHSLDSTPVWITVLERPPLPLFSVSPEKEIYARWEVITLTCSVSDKQNVTKLQFLKNQTELASLEAPSPPFTHSLQLLEQGGGNYSCRYWTVDSGQEMASQESNIVSISVADSPPRPVLKLDPPTGEVNEGDQVLLSCSTDRNRTEKRFHFYRDNVEMTPGEEGLFWSSREPGKTSTDASVAILQAKPSQRWELACSFEEEMSSRWISSPWSQKVNLTVLARLPTVPPQYAAVAVPFLVLMLLLVVYCMKKQKASKGQQAFELEESKEEADLDYLGMLTPWRQKQEESEITYADVKFCSASTPSKPVVRNAHEPAEEERVLYSGVRFQPPSRAPKSKR